jgi:Fe-S-cluster-containing dehydrogenase component
MNIEPSFGTTETKKGPAGMSRNISRRFFLKSTIAAAGALGASALPSPVLAQDRGRRGELATLIDIRKCIGCGACVEGCREANQARFPQPKKPFPKMYPPTVKVADWSEKRDVADRLTPYNWVFIQEAKVEVNGKQETFTFPRRCMHCENPPCANLCPWGAGRKIENGITVLDPDLCLGGAKCHDVCPWHIPQRQTGVGPYLDLMPALAGNGVMFKCDRCYGRIREGKVPACIEACPEEVQRIGPREEIVKEAHAIAAEISGYIYGEKENGGTNTIYVSPVPFERLDRAVAKGPGRPHLGPAEDSMGRVENLGKAMLIAPIAGIAAAIGKVYRSTRSSKQPEVKDR